MSTDVKTTSFEEGMEELESVVSRLEKGDLPLNESLAGFQRGVGLTNLCGQMLDEAERRVELLSIDEEGRSVLRPFDAEKGA